MKPGTLAARAINGYRSRDIFAYIGLRYYLGNQCSKRNQWANEIAVKLTSGRLQPIYFESNQFKELVSENHFNHRIVVLPGPTEAYAEAALLEECSKFPAFSSSNCVYSYKLAKSGTRSGMYEPYFDGFKERHKAVSDACKGGGVVLYTDIRRFYPSISKECAINAWQSACIKSQIGAKFADLGHSLILDHINYSETRNIGKAILTGPMFSHLIANLVMQPIDEAMKSKFPGRYFRYVDDVLLIGSEVDVLEGRKELSILLAEIELELHEEGTGKDFKVSAENWLIGENDFHQNDNKPWMNFVGALKRFLVTNPSKNKHLEFLFQSNEFRIPLPSYIAATKESQFQERLFKLIQLPWLRRKIRQKNASSLLISVELMRQKFSIQLEELLQINPNITDYSRKRVIPKLRYLSGRLLYLGTKEMLNHFAKILRAFPEMQMLAAVMNSVANRDVTEVLAMGSNAVQSAAQILRLETTPVLYLGNSITEISAQGLATLALNGITVLTPNWSAINFKSELASFSAWNEESKQLFKSENLFIQELACLHGTGVEARHCAILDSAFDTDEDISFDLINQLQQSSYF